MDSFGGPAGFPPSRPGSLFHLEGKMNKKIVIGFGTGRCGTKSLAKFLDNQPGFDVTHEGIPLGWIPAFADPKIEIGNLVERDAEVVGDVGFYWVHYLWLILKEYPDAKAINLLRDDEEVIESFWSYMDPDTQPHINGVDWKGYPFDSPYQTKDAIAFTVRRYRMMEAELHKMYPASIIQFDVEWLNDHSKLNLLLDWVAAPDDRVLQPIHLNSRQEILNPKRSKRPPHKRRFGG